MLSVKEYFIASGLDVNPERIKLVAKLQGRTAVTN